MAQTLDGEARLRAHIEALRAARGANDQRTPASQSPRSSRWQDGGGKLSSTAAATVAAAAPSSHPLVRLETFLAHAGGEPSFSSTGHDIQQQQPTPSHQTPLPSYDHLAPSLASAIDHDELVKATVRKAWDRAWRDYQTGKWLTGAPDLTASSTGGADGAPDGAAQTAPLDVAPPLPAASSGGGRGAAPAAATPTAYYDASLNAHPHLPADNRRQVTSYGAQASMKRRAASTESETSRRRGVSTVSR